MKPSTIAQHKIDRKGQGNPGVKFKLKSITFTKEDIKAAGKKLWDDTYNSDQPMRTAYKQLKKDFPDFMVLFSGMFPKDDKRRGYSAENYFWSHILDLPIDDIIKTKQKRRGLAISKGQLASEGFLAMASKMGADMMSTWRVTKPHLILFDMIQSVQPTVTLEHRVIINNRHKSFDIFDSSNKLYIEMHGHKFHDLAKTNDGLKEIVEKNIINDAIKEKFANNKGKYIVFWDDDTANWEQQIFKLYNKKCKPYEEVKSIVHEQHKEKRKQCKLNRKK